MNIQGTENTYPQPCENECIMQLVDPCQQCEDHYQYWAEVDNSEMDIDWSEYEDVITRELEKDIE